MKDNITRQEANLLWYPWCNFILNPVVLEPTQWDYLQSAIDKGYELFIHKNPAYAPAEPSWWSPAPSGPGRAPLSIKTHLCLKSMKISHHPSQFRNLLKVP